MPVKSRRQLNGKFLVILAVLAMALSYQPVAAEHLRIIPVPPNTVPEWTPLPDLPQVSYAPNIPTDVFKLRGRYFLLWEGVWYQSKKIKGPFARVDQPPDILSSIQADYFKMRPPGGPPPTGTAPLGPPRAEGLVTPEGKPAAPPPPEEVSPPAEEPQPGEPDSPTESPEDQEPAPLAIPPGDLPKVM